MISAQVSYKCVESVHLGEGRRIWRSLPPLSTPFSPTVDKGLGCQRKARTRLPEGLGRSSHAKSTGVAEKGRSLPSGLPAYAVVLAWHDKNESAWDPWLQPVLPAVVRKANE